MFDLLSTSYGWTDDQIMELPLVRFRQIFGTLQQRFYTEDLREEALVEWQTRSLASMIAGLGRSKRHAQGLFRQADSIRIRAGSSGVRSSGRQNESWTPGTPISPDDPRFARNTDSRVAMLVQGLEHER
jgi:hypothetical protein